MTSENIKESTLQVLKDLRSDMREIRSDVREMRSEVSQLRAEIRKRSP